MVLDAVLDLVGTKRSFQEADSDVPEEKRRRQRNTRTWLQVDGIPIADDLEAANEIGARNSELAIDAAILDVPVDGLLFDFSRLGQRRDRVLEAREVRTCRQERGCRHLQHGRGASTLGRRL